MTLKTHKGKPLVAFRCVSEESDSSIMPMKNWLKCREIRGGKGIPNHLWLYGHFYILATISHTTSFLMVSPSCSHQVLPNLVSWSDGKRLTLPSWLGQESGFPAAAALTDSNTLQASGREHSGSLCSTSMRFVMKKLFCSAATPFSGKMEVCLHTGQDSVKDWAGM